MVTSLSRCARWAGLGGSSGPRTMRNVGRSVGHRRSCCFACRETPRPQPPFVRTTQIGIAGSKRASTAFPTSPCHCPSGDHLTERPAETGAKAERPPVDVQDLHRLVLQSLDDDQAVDVIT